MKKFTLFALMAAAAMTASAQYTVDPTAETVLKGGKVTSVQYIALDEASVNAFTQQGAKVESAAPNEDNRNLWVWDYTFTSGDSSYPGVGMHFEGYASFTVGTVGWSGAGYNIAAPGLDTSTWNDETHFHLAYMSPGTPCTSVAIIIADGENDCGSIPAKFSLGTAFVDNGSVFPAIAPAANDDWQGIDITFGDLKKMWPMFDYKAISNWTGNLMSFLCGGITGQTIAFDAVYFYNHAGSGGVEAVETENDWVITANTINVNGAQGIELYNLAGQKVKATEGSTLGISNLNSGVYVARCGNQVRKIVK